MPTKHHSKTYFKQYRDSKGRFSKFEPGKELRPILLDKRTHHSIAEGDLKSRKREYNYTGAKGHYIDGRRIRSSREICIQSARYLGRWCKGNQF